jgi:DNA-binding GntR family transcriptional regulator
MTYVRKKTNTKQETAYQAIKNGIMTNDYPPNKMLSEDELSELLGFSKTPIREALRRLSVEGFVELISEKGAFVSNIGMEEYIEYMEVREALEGMAIRVSAITKDSQTLSLLNEQLDRIDSELN